MRAILFLDEIIDEKKIEIHGENAYHLIKVLRVKLNSDLLLLNTKGGKYFTKIVSISKKSLIVELISKEKEARKQSSSFSIAVCLPKKDALLEMANQAAQLGIYKLLPVKSEYSQVDLNTDKKLNDKLLKITQSGLIQSNNPYLVEIDQQRKFTDFIEIAKTYDQVIYLCSHSSINTNQEVHLAANNCGKTLIIIGPEAGLSPEEENHITQLDNCSIINLSTYIMRAPIAFGVAVGYCLGLMH